MLRTVNGYSSDDWKRLGRAIKRERVLHPAYRDMKKWADVIGRSTRALQGLERGETAGDETLFRIEQTLGWPVDAAWRILDGSADVAPSSGLSGADMAAARIARGIALDDLSRSTGVSVEILARWESGREPIAPGRVAQLREILFDSAPAPAPAIEAVPDSVLLGELLRRAQAREHVVRKDAI